MANAINMNAFLITSAKGTSEWKYSVLELQKEMNLLEKQGYVSSVKVQQFINSQLQKEVVYNWDGVEWKK